MDLIPVEYSADDEFAARHMKADLVVFVDGPWAGQGTAAVPPAGVSRFDVDEHLGGGWYEPSGRCADVHDRVAQVWVFRSGGVLVAGSPAHAA
jgi:hypothetical protein